MVNIKYAHRNGGLFALLVLAQTYIELLQLKFYFPHVVILFYMYFTLSCFHFELGVEQLQRFTGHTLNLGEDF